MAAIKVDHASNSEDCSFREVQLFKSQNLGAGGYYTVYRAKCDQLPCAAKQLHEVIFTGRGTGPIVLQRFTKECQYLKGLRHPHIVQYLGTYNDPESGIPVLLTELMDENLDHFLRRSQEPLPYSLQMNLCHDIAMALAYLHSNGIMYCNLESTKVLLKHKVAKLNSDVCMQKIGVDDPIQCPGSPPYMPPEALSYHPTYCEKIDVFSFGVLGVQILMKKFPDPSSHIDLIDPRHPLLPLFLDCLKDRDRDRPTAKEICDRLETLKQTPQYTSSAQHQQHPSDQRDVERLQAQLSEITAAKQEAETALLQKDETIQRTLQQLGEKDQMIQRIQLQLRQSQSQHTEFWKVPREEVTLDMQKFLGSGAWGFVVEGKFRGQRVAVKCLHNAIQHPTFIRTIRDEINIMAQIRHPNMVLLIAAVVGGDAEPPLIITELLDMSVRRAYERNLLQDSCKLSIFRDIACALNYLHLHHRGPFIHRDVNSANVLLEAKPNNQWKAKVSDFGSAKLIRDAKTTAPGATVYAAPEVRNEIGIRQTNKVDVYSYGVLLGEIILEEFPVDGLTPVMMEAIRSKWPLMHGLITDCTKDHPDNRPTMSDILDTITPRPRQRPQ